MLNLSALLLAVTVVAHKPGYYTSLANHVSRWLAGEQIAAKVVTAAEMPSALAREKIAFLIGFDAPSDAELKTLAAYRARGGKLVVFHSASPRLAALMGVKPLGYATAPGPGAWSRMDFAAGGPPGCPAHIRQTSTVLQRAMPIPGCGRVMATWSDRFGRPSGQAAWIATGGGYWMTHVLLADGDEDLKARLCAAIVGSVDARLWNMAMHEAREKATHERTQTLARAQVPRKGEIHAVWEHSGCGLFPGDWPRTIRLLRAARVTDIFVNVAGAGFAHYSSERLPLSRTFAQEGDQLAACLAAAKGSGIRVHAWVLCFTATRASPQTLAEFGRRGWRLVNAKGVPTDYLNPAHPAVRAHVLSVIDEIQLRYPGVSGIHLDFVRWYEGAPRPKNAAQVISNFVSEARRHVKRPRWLTAAVFGKYPACVATVGQDWTGWLDSRTVDYVVPMDYCESNEKFEGLLAQHAANRRYAAHTIVGIGVTANESRLDAAQVIRQIQLTRKHGLVGHALFDLDIVLARKVLPYLAMGIW